MSAPMSGLTKPTREFSRASRPSGVLVPAVIEHAVRLARGRGIPVVVDPKFRNFFAYRGATVFKPNRRELENALGAAVHLDEPDALPSTLTRLGVEELRTPGPDKGDSIRGFMETEAFQGARPVFAGDDITDEDGFEEVGRQGGFGVLVGRVRPSAARFGLRGVEDLLAWLEAAR